MMNSIVVQDFKDLAIRMIKNAMDGKCVAAVVFLDSAKNLMKAIPENDKDIVIGNVDLEFDECSSCVEYLVMLTSELVLTMEPAWVVSQKYNGYSYFYADLVYAEEGINIDEISNVSPSEYTIVYLDMHDGFEDDNIN